MGQPFIPRDKPKSFVIFVSAGLVALLVCGPIAFLGAYFEFEPLRYLGFIGAFSCAAAMFVSWPVFMFGLLTGKYRELPQREWTERYGDL
jgi:hypothetical protein